MFNAKTPKIGALAAHPALQESVQKLEQLLVGKVHMYIDFANVRPWAAKLKWHIDAKRLSQFLASFERIESIKWCQGELVGDPRSESEIKKLHACGYVLRTKHVKIMRLSIDTTSISDQSPDLLRKFVRQALLRKYDIATVEYLNQKFAAMNDTGEFYIEDRKCNFDVEIGTDMRVDELTEDVETFVLWSGDSDFADTIRTLLQRGKRVVLFGTAGRISHELNELKKEGLIIFDIYHLRDFICRKDEQRIKVSV